ncbi:MAG: hypothetical protein LBK82_08725 [Planctomycetaceae bacterium]|nr:hypothetical protein [Planctomycetaceae bacterium]
MGNLWLKGCVGVSRLAPVNGGNLIPKRKAIPFTVVNPAHCRLSPTRPFSEKSPTYKRLLTYKRLPT